MNNFIVQYGPLLIGALVSTGALTWAFTHGAAFLKAHTQSKELQNVIDTVEHFAEGVAAKALPVIAADLKAGKGAGAIGGDLVAQLKAQLGEEGMADVKELVGDGVGIAEGYLQGAIAKAANAQVSAAGAAAAAGISNTAAALAVLKGGPQS